MSDKPTEGAVPVPDVVPAAAPDTVNASLPKPPNPAKWMHERVVRQLIDFEKNLADDQEVGGQFVQAPGNATIHINGVGFWGPDMLVFHGESPDGQKFQLMQHYTQVSVLLVSVPKQKEEARRIGFDLLREVEADDSE